MWIGLLLILSAHAGDLPAKDQKYVYDKSESVQKAQLWFIAKEREIAKGMCGVGNPSYIASCNLGRLLLLDAKLRRLEDSDPEDSNGDGVVGKATELVRESISDLRKKIDDRIMKSGWKKSFQKGFFYSFPAH